MLQSHGTDLVCRVRVTALQRFHIDADAVAQDGKLVYCNSCKTILLYYEPVKQLLRSRPQKACTGRNRCVLVCGQRGAGECGGVLRDGLRYYGLRYWLYARLEAGGTAVGSFALGS